MAFFACFIGLASAVLAQDAAKISPRTYKVVYEDDKVRVLEYVSRPGLGVSVPVAWDELPELSGGAHWTIRNVHERLKAGNDPWAGYAKTRQTLGKAMKALGFEPS